MEACKAREKLDKYHFYHNKWIPSLSELLAAKSKVHSNSDITYAEHQVLLTQKASVYTVNY